jgi:hypothetical protein
LPTIAISINLALIITTTIIKTSGAEITTTITATTITTVLEITTTITTDLAITIIIASLSIKIEITNNPHSSHLNKVLRF